MTNDFSGANLAGTTNILTASAAFNNAQSTGFVAAVGNPNLDSNGHLSGNSDIADRKAVGSTLNIDVDGDARPWLGTVADIGADEGFVVPVELSTFTVN